MEKKIINGFSKEISFFDQTLVDLVAADMVNLATKVKRGENVLLQLDPGARQLALAWAKLAVKKGARVYYLIQDRELNAEILKGSSKKDIARFYSFDNSKFFEADVTLIARCPRTAFAYEEVESWRMNEFNQAMGPALMEWRVNYSRWCLIYWPTEEEAKLEGLSYSDYVRLFFQACQQPWAKIARAQQKLVELLDRGKELVLMANPADLDKKKRTSLEMSIQGMGFLNSTIEKNYPGSEVFSAPVRESVNGQVFAQGLYSYNGKRMEDIYLRFENGQVVSAEARKGENHLVEILDADEGAKFLGEIALGTNPGLKRRLFNPLLNEKVGGSFHFALGRSYQDERVKNKMVKLFNGNLSKIHWDITILMRKEYGGGAVIVDGQTIQKDGRFLIKELAILNHK